MFSCMELNGIHFSTNIVLNFVKTYCCILHSGLYREAHSNISARQALTDTVPLNLAAEGLLFEDQMQ